MHNMTAVDTMKVTLDAHTNSIDALHERLASMPGVDKERLKAAVAKYKDAARAFQDDALGCMN
jgi:hypothetical protein